MRTLVPLLALAALTVDVSAARAGACAPRVPMAGPLTATPTLAPGGGVVIGWSPTGEHGLHHLAKWKLRARGSKARSHQTPLAPGLAIVTLPGKARNVTLVDERGAKIAAVAVAATAPPPLAAPTATALFERTYYSPRQAPRPALLADLAVPDDAALVLVYDAAAPATDPAISWTVVSPGVQATLYAGPGRCEVKPSEMRGVAVGAKVQLAWVDRLGRVSPRSAPIVVAPDPVPVDPSRSPIPAP